MKKLLLAFLLVLMTCKDKTPVLHTGPANLSCSLNDRIGIGLLHVSVNAPVPFYTNSRAEAPFATLTFTKKMKADILLNLPG